MAKADEIVWKGPEQLRSCLVAIDSLEPWPGNPNRGDVAEIAKSFRRFGQLKSIVVNDGRITAGHHMALAALELGWTHIAAVDGEFSDEEEARAFLVADNQIPRLGTVDDEALAVQLAALRSYEGTGFSEADRNALTARLAALRPSAPEDTLEPPTDPVSRLGEVYELGRHRLMCGDSTVSEDVAVLLAGERPALCVTDPPYGVSYDPAWRDEEAAKGHLAFAARRVGEVRNDDRADWREAWELFPGDVMYVWHASLKAEVQAGIEAAGFDVRSQIIWVKPHVPISRGHYHWRHEICWYAVRRGGTANWTGDRSQTTVWDAPLDPNVDGGHSTQKPVALMIRPLANHAGDVYDPFVGSGTTLVAAERAGRRCFAMELDPAYVDVVRLRYSLLVGDASFAP